MAERPAESDLKFDNMTRQDLKKIEKSMKRPEFMGLLNEYMIEISDPKNKNEYDEYLRQMEREKELPKHMKIVELKPKFCFRTFIVSQKNKKHEMKFFVNMCETEYLEKPSCQPTPGDDGKLGYSWKIPNSSGKIRYDQDKKGSPCQVIDVAFHTDTFLFAARKEFQEMMINIALEAAEKQLGERKESLSRDYVILKNVICKGQDGKPALMPIRYIEGKVYNKGEGPTAEPERDNEGRETKLQKEINKQKEEHDKAKVKPAGKDELEKEEEIEESKLVVDLDEGVQRPKYSTIFTYPVDYSEFIDNPAMNTRRKVPSAFNIEFAIPRVESITEIADQKLQINDKQIILKIGEKYFIDLELEEFKLKYVIQTALAKAKYDKKKKALRIVIPVDQSVNYHPEETLSSESKQQPQEQEQEKPNIVETQVWKNKVLDFTEQSVSVKMLNNEEVQEEKPKLVEEIDEEDEITEPQQKVEKAEEEQEVEETKKSQEKFSLSHYYKKTEPKESNIKFVFQQTADKILLVFQMKNYRKEELFTLISPDQEYLLDWREGGHPGHFAHLQLKQDFIGKVLKAEVVHRVGFIAFTITKAEKGKYWEKQSIGEVQYAEYGEAGYEHFRQAFQKIQQAQKAVEIVEKPVPVEQKVEQPAKQPNDLYPEDQSKAEPIETLEQVPRAEPAAASEVPKGRSIFNSLQVQFISFNAAFVDILD